MSEVVRGISVVYIDSTGHQRPALVTNVFGPPDKFPSINVVVVNQEETQTDSYGSKIERFTSVSHQSAQWAHGNMWRFVDEARIVKTA
jgi:hypothetical protein